MLKVLQEWICDVCGEVIRRPEAGYVVWKDDEQGCYYDFKVIHQSRCDREDDDNSQALEDFLGENGLTVMLSFLSLGPIKKNLGDGGAPGVRDLDEWVNLVRRFQIPYYEEARQKFSQRELLDRLSDSNEVAPYMTDSLREIVADA